MCDSFDMACHDASSALQLNIEVNSENLLPSSQRYNVGSLRLPADPSWPKIPQRRLADDLGEVIEPPCVVTLTGTPKKSRTTVRPSHPHQSAKPTFSRDQVPGSFHNVYQKTPTPNHPMKRRPGCADPRFKRVTTVKSQMTPSEPSDRDCDNHTEQSRSALIIPNQTQCPTENVRKIVPEKDTDLPKVTQQEAEKPGELKEMDSVAVQTMPTEVQTIQSDDDSKKNSKDTYVSPESEDQKKVFDDSKLSQGESLDTVVKNSPGHIEDEKSTYSENDQKPEKVDNSKEKNSLHNLTIVPNSHLSVKHESACLQYCQGNAGQLFLVVENKVQTPALSAIQIDPSPVSACQYNSQCYNVQVPVLSYQNLPLQISTQTPAKFEIPSQLSLSPLLTIPSSPSLKNPANIPPQVANADLSGTSQEPDVTGLKQQHSTPVHIIGQVSDTVSNSLAPETRSATCPKTSNRILLEDSKTGHRYSDKNDKTTPGKNPIGSDIEAEQRRKTLGTPPIKLERQNAENFRFNDVKIDPDRTEESFDKSALSDTTDSEFFGVKTAETKTNRFRRDAKETSGSGTDCDDCFRERSKIGNADLGQTKKRRKQICCSTTVSKDVACSKNTEARCLRAQASSIDDRESSKQRDCKRFSGYQRKMKSEQNLARSLPFGEKNYKNISDPHITGRETYGDKDALPYRSSQCNARHKLENRFTEEIVDEMCETSCNQRNTDITTEIDSDAQNFADFCDTDRTDLSNIEESKNAGDALAPDKPTVLPVKTQQLLNKSYMEYYDKLRSSCVEKDESAQQRYICQMAMGAPQLKKRRASLHGEIRRIDEQNESSTGILTLEKLSALSNIINRNLNPAEKNSNDTTQTRQLYVNENMRSSSDPTAGTQSATLKGIMAGDSADLYDSSVPSTTLIDKVKRKREKPVERRLLKLKTIAFFGFMMYAMLVLLPLIYNYFLYDEYDDYEDLSYIELMLEYVVSSFREAFGGLFDTINDLFFRPVRLD